MFRPGVIFKNKETKNFLKVLETFSLIMENFSHRSTTTESIAAKRIDYRKNESITIKMEEKFSKIRTQISEK